MEAGDKDGKFIIIKTRLKEGTKLSDSKAVLVVLQEAGNTHPDASKADDSNKKLWNQQTKA